MNWRKLTQNFYFISGVLFLVWLTFFDSNDLINQFRLSGEQSRLENEKAYYKKKIVEVEKKHQELMSDPQTLERYAREVYLMKKPTEDIYVVVEEQD